MTDNISEQMRATITGFGEAVRSQNVYQIGSFYENGGLKLNEKSKQVEWPSVDTVASIVQGSYRSLFSQDNCAHQFSVLSVCLGVHQS
jgi:hypothetical protein